MNKEEYIDLVTFDQPFNVDTVQLSFNAADIKYRMLTDYRVEPDSAGGMATVWKLQVMKQDYEYARKRLKALGFYIDPNEPGPNWYRRLELSTQRIAYLRKYDLLQRLMILFGIVVLGLGLLVYFITEVI